MRTKATQPPVIDRVELGELRSGDARDLAPRAEIDSVEFAEVKVAQLALSGASLDGVRFAGLRAERADLAGAAVAECVFTDIDVPVVAAGRSRWRDAVITGRLGALDANESTLRSVHFSHCKLGYVNLRGAELLDVLFTDCRIDELDLGSSKARRVAFESTEIASLDVHHAQLQDVDLRGADLHSIAGPQYLRGATISELQLTLLAPVFAAHLGIKTEG